MPVRKIPKSFRAVTGRFPSVINGRCVSYESKLERDYFLRLEFDPSVASYEEQPVQIPGNVKGQKVTYVLDCLVYFKTERRPLLVELKYAEELEENAEKLDLKFVYSREFAEKNDFDFAVVTEKQIYDSAFENFGLLYRFTRTPADYEIKSLIIIDLLKDSGVMAFGELLHSISPDKLKQAEYLPVLWHMIFTRTIETDLNTKIDYNSDLRLANGDKDFT